MNTDLRNIFVHQQSHNAEILELLEKTTIGTNGARYRHLHTREKINDLHQPHFFTIYRHDKAIANITLCKRPVYVKNRLIDSVYIRYFAFDRIFQTSENKKANQRKTSAFQRYIDSLFSTSNLDVTNPEYQPSVFWAIVDPENNRSKLMADRYGFETISKIKTVAFSRFFPRLHQNVSRLKPDEHENVWSDIKAFYNNYSNLTRVHLFKHNNYFVYRENGKIVAGIQANKTQWKIEALPGFKGKVLVKTLPYIPLINRIINPNQYNFLATEGLFWAEGHEDKVNPLLESVLALQNNHSLLIWVDTKDQKLGRMMDKLNLGLLQKLKSDNAVDILAKFNHFPDDLRHDMIHSNHYITGFDTT